MKASVGILCLTFLISCFGFVGSHAGWIENGAPLTRQWKTTGEGVIVPDGYSGVIIAYQICHAGARHIVAQRVDSLGTVLWGDEGISVCTAATEQYYPEITPDGVGGVIVMWVDSRSGGGVYAQRVNASGAVEWRTDGVALCTATGSRYNHRIISDGAGGAIVTWEDSRDVHGIYAQRVNASGTIEWTTNGVAICTATEYQYSPEITSDGVGGAIVTWDDSRSGTWDIYAQRVDGSGVIQWTTDGVALCVATGSQSGPRIISDGAGGGIVTWRDDRNANDFDIYSQRVNASGAVEWTTDGVALCVATGSQSGPRIISDGAGGGIVTWRDDRNANDFDIYSQRVNASGAVEWTTDGVALCSATGSQYSPTSTSDGAGGAIVAWIDYRNGNCEIYAQKVDGSGTIEWMTDGVVLCTAMEDQPLLTITSDNAGGAIIIWREYSADIYGQIVNASGVPQWTVNGTALSTSTGSQYYPTIASDDAGGSIVAWQEKILDGDFDIHVQKVDTSGTVLWTINGVSLCAAAGSQCYPRIASDGSGGAFVAWRDDRSGNYDIYTQHVNASGTIEWAADGAALCTATGDQDNLVLIHDGAGGAIIAWSDDRNGNSDIFAQKVDASGAVQWTTDGVAICVAAEKQSEPRIVSDEAGGAIITWEDWRSGNNYDIYAQRVNASGSVEWTMDGVSVCSAVYSQDHPAITSDGGGGAIIAWQDGRGGGYDDIYAQRLNASGACQWTADGIPICVEGFGQQYAQITSDDAGGAVVVWFDWRTGRWTIYAQKVNAAGTVEWAANGVALFEALTSEQYTQFSICSDDAGGVIAAWWWESVAGSRAIYVQRVDASGAVQWTPIGTALCRSHWLKTFPAIASDGENGAIVAWQDNRCGILIYAQRVRSSGDVVSTLLQHCSAARTARGIRVDWSLSEIDEDTRFSILRASVPEWQFFEFENTTIERNGLSFTCTDKSCLPGSTYKYRVECVVEGSAPRVLFETDSITIPALPLTLYQNHPNPFNPQTLIRFYLPEAQEILLDVYNVAGERVARLAQGKKEKGFHQVIWDGRNGSGNACSSGVYFSRLRVGKNTVSHKMVIMR